MKDTLAIVGSYTGTRGLFDFDRTDCDIWVFNEVLGSKEQEWCKRADGVFQMHKPVIWRSKTNHNDPKHYQWLQSQDEAVIYMQDKFEDVPMSEKYPLDEIFEAFPTAEKYLTSSVAYSIALAIYKGYKYIDVYGVEMATNTEYGHQRVGVAYWIGFAAGHGIYVNFHSPSFFKAPLYGYEGDVAIPIEFYETYLEKFGNDEPKIEAAFEEAKDKADFLLKEFEKTYKTDLSDLDVYIMAMGQNSQNFGMVEGAKKVCDMFIAKSKEMLKESDDYLIVRQEFEGTAISAGKEIYKAEIGLRRIGDDLHHLRKKLNTNDSKAVRERLANEMRAGTQKYVVATQHLGHLHGALQMNKILIAKLDQLLIASGIEPPVRVPQKQEKAEVDG